MSKELSPAELTGAMMTTEPDVELPSRVRVYSVVGNLIALEVGGVYTLSQELPLDRTLSQVQEIGRAHV